MSRVIDVQVELDFEIDTEELSPEYRTADGVSETVEEVLDACVYDIPGATLKRISIDIEGLD